MSSLIVRGAKIEDASIYRSKGGQLTVDVKFRASWSDVVCETMAWTKEPSGFGNGALEGQLFGVSMMLEPTSKNLKDYRLDIGISQVSKFRHLAKTEDGEVVSRELEFIVSTIADDAPAVISEYIRHCGPGDDRGQLKLTYSAEEQQTLGEEGAPAEEKPRGRKKAAKAE
jgi:hypothetical protein